MQGHDGRCGRAASKQPRRGQHKSLNPKWPTGLANELALDELANELALDEL